MSRPAPCPRTIAGVSVDAQEPEEQPERGPIDVRFSYANERTFLAWNRTALALVTAGLAVTQLLPPFDVPGGRRMIGLPLIALGVIVASTSFVQWQRNEEAMVRREPLPRSLLPLLVAVVVAISAAVALGLAIFSPPST